MGVAIGGSAAVTNPIPINPYKKKTSQQSFNPTTIQAATNAELLSYFDKVLPDVSEKDSTDITKPPKKVASTKKPSSKKGKKKPPQTPVALNAHQGWTIVDSNDFEPLSFDFQESYLDELLTTRAISYIQHFRQRFNDKLKVNLLEPTELNVFQLLTSPALESVCEYSNESLNLNGRTLCHHLSSADSLAPYF
jgi:hypothetical protein